MKSQNDTKNSDQKTSIRTMKTSNIIFTLAIVFYFGMLVSYNLELKAEYKKGDFRSPFYGYKKFEFNNFEKIKINGGNALVVKISKGTENAVYIDAEQKDRVKIRESGETLSIVAEEELLNDSKPVLIVCSSLKEITTNAIDVFTWNPKTKERLKKIAPVWNSGTFLTGFYQDSLNVHVGTCTYITIEKSNLRKIRAIVVGEKDATLNLIDSKIGSSDIEIQGSNHLKILNTDIKQRKEILSDNAMITLSGRIINQ